MLQIYSSSILIYQHQGQDRSISSHYSLSGLSLQYSTLENFMNFCELEVRQLKAFAISDVDIVGYVMEVSESGILNTIATSRRSFSNQGLDVQYDSEYLENY